MNIPRFPAVNELDDAFRPKAAFWGPVLGQRNEHLADVMSFAELSNPPESPQHCGICFSGAIGRQAVVYGYPVYACERCGAGFVWPQPEDDLLARYYGSQYGLTYLGDPSPIYDRAELRNHILRRQAELLDSLLGGNKSARILDVGAGDGSMLRVLKDMGYKNLLGVDLSSPFTRRAQESLGVEVRNQDFLSFHEPGWDAVTLWAVIEHLKDPLRFMSHAASLLVQGGLAVVMTGDNSSLCARIQKCFDCWMYPPEHLYFFGSTSLVTLLKNSGFVGVRCQLGFQNYFKERILLLSRLAFAAKVMLRKKTRPRWRSVNSNLLTAWGVRS